MKKLITAVVVLGLIFAGGFFILLSQTGPDKAPQDIVTVDLTDGAGK